MIWRPVRSALWVLYWQLSAYTPGCSYLFMYLQWRKGDHGGRFYHWTINSYEVFIVQWILPPWLTKNIKGRRQNLLQGVFIFLPFFLFPLLSSPSPNPFLPLPSPVLHMFLGTSVAQQSQQSKVSQYFISSAEYSTVFRSGQNWVSVSDESRMVGDSVFYKVGPETAKHRCPYLDRGAARSPCVAQRRWLRLTHVDTGVAFLHLYMGAFHCRI